MVNLKSLLHGLVLEERAVIYTSKAYVNVGKTTLLLVSVSIQDRTKVSHLVNPKRKAQ